MEFCRKTKIRICGGFTLVEMLVVIGIIGMLAIVMVSAASHMKATARRTHAQAMVSEVATALTVYLERYREWPEALTKRTKYEFDRDACWVLQEKKLYDVTVKVWSSSEGKWIWQERSLDRFGLLDPWGRDALKRNPSATESSTIVSGTALSDHRLQYRLDTNYDGKVNGEDDPPAPTNPKTGSPMDVRASVLVWSRGPDGIDDFENSKKRYPSDDSLSWNYEQF